MQTAYWSVLSLLCACGAWLDWRFRLLPNLLCAVAFASGIAFAFALHDARWAALCALHAVLALVVGMVLFSRKWIGGGDAKFYAGLAAWMPVTLGWLLISSVSLAGLVLLTIWFPFRRKFAPATTRLRVETDSLSVPYGVAIAAGALAANLLRVF